MSASHIDFAGWDSIEVVMTRLALTLVPTSATAPFISLTPGTFMVPMYEGTAVSLMVLRVLGPEVNQMLARERFVGASGQVLSHWLPSGQRVLLIGLGKPLDVERSWSEEATLSAAGLVAKMIKKHEVVDAVVVFPDFVSLSMCYRGLLLGAYEFSRKKEEGKRVCTVKVHTGAALLEEEVQQQIISEEVLLAEAVCKARDLVSEGANEVTPRAMVRQAEWIASHSDGRVHCVVLGRHFLEHRGMNLILAVSKGSQGSPESEPALVHLTYTPEGEVTREMQDHALTIIGKGVTFDSGGVSIKTAEQMRFMKTDMGGAAAVLGLMQFLAATKTCQEVVHGIFVVTDNMTGPLAAKVGDIYKSMNGMTVEIANTDAEGRLLLADALTYAQRAGLTRIVTMATLTGAQLIALGPITALYANELAGKESMPGWTGLCEEVLLASKLSAERVHQMPLDWRLRSLLDSKGGADLCNITGVPFAGAGTAALFLNAFVEPGTELVHLDIAGTSSSWGLPLNMHHVPEAAGMGTGWGVALLIAMLSFGE